MSEVIWTPAARFTVGLEVERFRPGATFNKVGSLIDPASAQAEFLRLRSAQVGEEAAIEGTRVAWNALEHPTRAEFTVTFRRIPRLEGTVRIFDEHMRILGQQLALHFGQEVVNVWMGKGAVVRPRAAGDSLDREDSSP